MYVEVRCAVVPLASGTPNRTFALGGGGGGGGKNNTATGTKCAMIRFDLVRFDSILESL